jgi:hypothetical protein
LEETARVLAQNLQAEPPRRLDSANGLDSCEIGIRTRNPKLNQAISHGATPIPTKTLIPPTTLQQQMRPAVCRPRLHSDHAHRSEIAPADFGHLAHNPLIRRPPPICPIGCGQ